MQAFQLDLRIEQGATFAPEPLQWARAGSPVNLAECTARLQVRHAVDDADVLLELTTENGGIVLDPQAGSIALLIPAEQTEGIEWRSGVYDLEVVQEPTGRVRRLCQGRVTVSPNVTR